MLGGGIVSGSLIGIPEAGAAGEALKVDTGDTAWVLTSTALVLAMRMKNPVVQAPGFCLDECLRAAITSWRACGSRRCRAGT